MASQPSEGASLQGHSRYDAMTDLRRPLWYPNLGGCGHLQFTGEPLQTALQVTGWVEAVIWVESCDQDADLFCYLQSFDSATGSVAYDSAPGCLTALSRSPAAG